jgi:hypothetical protein
MTRQDAGVLLILYSSSSSRSAPGLDLRPTSRSVLPRVGGPRRRSGSWYFEASYLFGCTRAPGKGFIEIDAFEGIVPLFAQAQGFDLEVEHRDVLLLNLKGATEIASGTPS